VQSQFLSVVIFSHSLHATKFKSQFLFWYCGGGQARRQDLAAGGQKPERGAKNQKGGHILKIQYWIYAATSGPNVKWEAPISNGGAGHHWLPRWRRPWWWQVVL